ncbi:MAG: pyruvate dehydrogenase complex dihydrolipoamide acetyltransferase [Saprospiraceae bacterium]|nr:pyruvate dehydrogenase complex dihydrolipoamide acetyltransferase [Saprospiraceae bacterium]
MAEIIRMPRLSDTMEEGVIIGWSKKVGDKVSPGDILAEVETDKATMELESFHEGYLLYIGVKSGAVPVDGVIAVIGEKGEDFESALKRSSGSADESKKEKKEEKLDSKEERPAQENQEAQGDSKNDSEEAGSEENDKESADQRVKASPLAKSIAKESGVDLNKIQGSGDQGRIIRKDVEAAMSSGSASPSMDGKSEIKTPAPSFSMEDSSREVPVNQMRKTIARRLGESKFSAPHFYLTMEIDMDNAIAARAQLNEIAEQKISFNDIVVKACAAALRKHPAVNSSWLGDKISYHQHIHIGVAVGVEDGLLVPVIRNADFKSLSQLNSEIKTLAGKAKEKKLQPAEMQGNTFTISNLGMFDIDEFTAIINPPDACILAVGSIKSVPVVKNGLIVPGNIMKVTLSCDHRVVDGVTGAKFLQTVKEYIENPIRLVL